MKILIFSLFLFVVSFKTFAQADAIDTEKDLKMYASYTSTLTDNLKIFNGREYSSYLYPLEGSPFYLDSTHLKGSLIYNDVFYENISLTYDIIKDQLLANTNSTIKEVIISEKSVHQFSLGHHHFINLSFIKDLDEKGYYEVLGEYTDAILLSKRQKKIKENLEGNYKKQEVEAFNSYYYLKSNKLNKLTDWRSIYQLFPEKKKRIKKLKMQKKLKFKSQTETVIRQVIDFAETN